MELEISVDSDVSHVKLPQNMAITEVAAFKVQLQRVVDARPARVVVDLDAVISVDTASLQLLASFVITTTRNGGRVQWDNLSVPMYMTACQLNLEEHLQF